MNTTVTDRYDRTAYKCNGCRHSWELVDGDPWPAVRYHVEACRSTVSRVEHREMRDCGIWKSYVSRRETLSANSWEIA